MAILKCKMCGGDLLITDGSTIAECEYCGSIQTLPRVNDDRLASFYERANDLRMSHEFDKAVEICKKWGMPYIDLWHSCYLNPNLSWMHDDTKIAAENRKENKCYYADNQHLTSKGYDFTAELIENWINTL